MKKITGLLLTAALLAAMLTVFAVPAFAEDAPTEVVPDHYSITLEASGNYIINRDCQLIKLMTHPLYQDITLTIAEGVTVTVTDNFNNNGTIHVLGTLILSDTIGNATNFGTVCVYGCCGGTLEGQIQNRGIISTYDEHNYVDGKCACGHTSHTHNYQPTTVYICDCGETAPEGYVPDDATASVLSEGSLTVIVGIACAAAFGFGGFLLGTKKKPALTGAGSDGE